MDLKKGFRIILIVTFFWGTSLVVANANAVPTDQCGGSHEALYGKYPMVGADEASVYYLDPSSCYATVNGNVATLGCLIYRTGGGAAPDGGPYKLTPYVITFQTYKKSGHRKIILKNAVSRGKFVTASMLKYDDGLLNNLFWMVADETGISSNLD